MFKRLALTTAIVLSLGLITGPAFAQSSCGNNATPPLSGGGSVFGSIVSQWIQYFAQKIDVNSGVACNITLNGTISGTAFPFPPASLGTAATKNVGKSVNDPGTGSLENLVPVQTSTGAGPIAGISSGAYLQEKIRRSNSTTAMTDTLPASTITGLANGARIDIANVDASASDTISAGAGTTIASGSSYVLVAGRDIHLVYDLANTDWKFDANTSTALLNGGPLGTPSSGTATNLSGTAESLTAGNVTTNANLTGPITSSGNATSIASQTGTGTKFVVDTSPTLVTPNIGVAVATSINGNPLTSGVNGVGYGGTGGTYGSGTPNFRVYLGTSETPSSGVLTKITYDTVTTDTASAWDNTNHRYTANVAGLYSITASVDLNGTSASQISIRKNGASTLTTYNFATPIGAEINLTLTDQVRLNGSTDYVEAWGNATGTSPTFGAGATLSVIQGSWIGP